MIIWGSRGVTSLIEQHEFNCPQCASLQRGNLKQIRNFFTLYFIPIIPLNVQGRFVDCSVCGGQFSEEILAYDPEKERDENNLQMLRVMVMAALADGEVDRAERAEIVKQYMELAGLPIPESTLENEIGMARSADTDLNVYVSGLANQLSPHGKGLVVKLAFKTMSASGDLQPGHQEQLSQLSKTLQIPEDQYRELIKMVSSEDAEA